MCAALKCPPGTSDDDADPKTPCVACKLGSTFVVTAGKVGKCKDVQKCPAGKEAIPEETAKDVPCDPCGKGKFRTAGMPQFVASAGRGNACQPWGTTCKETCVDKSGLQTGCSLCFADLGCKRSFIDLVVSWRSRCARAPAVL